MTVQPVRLSLWRLWDTEMPPPDPAMAQAETDRLAVESQEPSLTSPGQSPGDPVIDRAKDLVDCPANPTLHSPSVRGDLNCDLSCDLFIDWPIPEAGFVSGSAWGTADRRGRSLDRSFDLFSPQISPQILTRSQNPRPVASKPIEPSLVEPSLVEPRPTGLLTAQPTAPSSLAQPRNTPLAPPLSAWGAALNANLALRQWPSPLQRLQDHVSSQSLSNLGRSLGTWVDRIGHHPWSKPALLLALPWGTAAVAIQGLTAVPGTGSCHFNPLLLSDLDQLHCAREQMRSQEPQQVIQGFRRLRDWSKDQMLYPVAERQLQSWAMVLLSLARHQFDQGQWQDAEALLAEIPASSPLYGEAQAQKQAWQRVQRQGEELLDQAKSAIAAQRWQKARTYAQQLTDLSNDYWRRQGLETLSGQIDRQANQPARSPESMPLAMGSQPRIPVRMAQPEFSIA